MIPWLRSTISPQTTGSPEARCATAGHQIKVRDAFFFFAILLSVSLVYLVWIRFNYLPPLPEAAYNQLLGLQLQKPLESGLMRGFPDLCGQNPPLYCLQEALVFRFLGATPYIALLSNAAGLLLLSYCTYRIAAGCSGPASGLLAGSLVLIMPMTALSNRETLADVMLAGWVACSMLLLLKTECMQKKSFSVLLGASAAAGTLTMSSYPLVMTLPIIWSISKAPDRRRAVENCLDTLFVALLGTLWWYLPNARALLGFAGSTEAKAAFQRNPTLDGAIAWTNDVQAVLCWCVALILTLLVVVALVRQSRSASAPIGMPVELVILWLAGSLIAPFLSIGVQPYYMVPVAAPLSILLAHLGGEWTRVARTLAVCATVLFVWVPLPMRQLLTPPVSAHKDGQYSRILSTFPHGALIGFLPRLPRFHAAGLQLAAALEGRRMDVYQVGCSPASIRTISLMTHVVSKWDARGISCSTRLNLEVVDRIAADGWSAEHFALPDGTWAVVWTNPIAMPVTAQQLDGWQGSLDYLLLRARVVRVLRSLIPENAKTLVICKGDDELLRLLGPRFMHFPQSQDGGYTGYYPANGAEAVEQLQKIVSRKAAYIVFLQPSLWWLDYYPELKSYLDLNARVVFQDYSLAFVYAMRSRPMNPVP
jgi:hypothetical protein